MGYIRHHAIVVTSCFEECIAEAHAKALELFGERRSIDGGTMAQLVTPLTPAMINGFRSFAVLPDGSKEWWDLSDAGDAARAVLIEWMGRYAEDGGNYVDWVEVQFGDDDRQTLVTNDSDALNRV